MSFTFLLLLFKQKCVNPKTLDVKALPFKWYIKKKPKLAPMEKPLRPAGVEYQRRSKGVSSCFKKFRETTYLNSLTNSIAFSQVLRGKVVFSSVFCLKHHDKVLIFSADILMRWTCRCTIRSFLAVTRSYTFHRQVRTTYIFREIYRFLQHEIGADKFRSRKWVSS